MVGASGVKGQPGRCTGKGMRPANAGGLRGLGEHLDFTRGWRKSFVPSFIHSLNIVLSARHGECSPFHSGAEMDNQQMKSNAQSVRCWGHGGKRAGEQDGLLGGWLPS